MRIITGTLGGRTFNSPAGHRTHPMSDKMRGALFNTLGDVEGLTILDSFGGSGALSFEAVSRGAAKALVLEVDSSAVKTIRANIQTLQLASKVKAVHANANAWLSTVDPPPSFDIVLCDPPYEDIQPTLLAKLAACVKRGGIVVHSLPPYTGFTLDSESFELLTHKSYGDAELAFYRRIA